MFDRRSLYACDLDSKVKYQAQTIANGIYTINDWRRLENQPQVEGGDTVMISANLKSLSEWSSGNELDPSDTPEPTGNSMYNVNTDDNE